MSTIFAYLESQRPEDLNELYTVSWSTLAVFQSLDKLAQQIVMRLLGMRGWVMLSFIHAWVKPTEDCKRHLKASIDALRRLNILGSPAALPAEGVIKALDMNGTADTASVGDVVTLNNRFRVSLQEALTTADEVPWQARTRDLPPMQKEPDTGEVEEWAALRWNATLHFLVGSYDAPEPPPKVVEMLVATRLLALGAGEGLDEAEAEAAGGEEAAGAGGGAAAASAAAAAARSGITDRTSTTTTSGGPSGGRPPPPPAVVSYEEIVSSGGALHVTRGGYEFLLRDTSVQLWTFMHQYLTTAEARREAALAAAAEAGGGGAAAAAASASREPGASSILAFLFALGFCRLGEGYAVAALTKTQRRLLEDLSSIGLIYVPATQRISKSGMAAAAERARARGEPPPTEFRRFYPTSLAIVLSQPEVTSAETLRAALAGSAALASASSSSSSSAAAPAAGAAAGGSADAPLPGAAAAAIAALSTATGGGGLGGATTTTADGTLPGGGLSGGVRAGKLHLVVEKNFKVYAYTRTDLHVALLALFTKIDARLPNLVVATLTRRSVLQAMEKGITAPLIAHFLQVHAHPAVAAHGPPVPETVVDQLHLWERERHRITFRTQTRLLDEFPSLAYFRECCVFLAGAGGLLYSNEATKTLVVSEAAFPAAVAWLQGKR